MTANGIHLSCRFSLKIPLPTILLHIQRLEIDKVYEYTNIIRLQLVD